MRGYFKVFAKVKFYNIHCSPLIHRAIITENYQKGQAQFALHMPVLLVCSAAVCYISTHTEKEVVNMALKRLTL